MAVEPQILFVFDITYQLWEGSGKVVLALEVQVLQYEDCILCPFSAMESMGWFSQVALSYTSLPS